VADERAGTFTRSANDLGGLPAGRLVPADHEHSTAAMRYLVLPMRPEGTEALTEAEPAGLVTRDSMIG
jgi:hypothetical protein